MQDDQVHWDDPGFDEFIEEELSGLADRAQARGICLDCLSDRLIFEVIAGLVRGGVPDTEILALVEDALEDAEREEDETAQRPPRMH
jgi:hypothetical protein